MWHDIMHHPRSHPTTRDTGNHPQGMEWDDVVNKLQAKHALMGFTFLKNSIDLFLAFQETGQNNQLTS